MFLFKMHSLKKFGYYYINISNLGEYKFTGK